VRGLRYLKNETKVEIPFHLFHGQTCSNEVFDKKAKWLVEGEGELAAEWMWSDTGWNVDYISARDGEARGQSK
jgi:hypothetical protein